MQNPNSPAPPPSPILPCHLFPALIRTKLPQTLPLGPNQVPGTGNCPQGPSQPLSGMTDKRC